MKVIEEPPPAVSLILHEALEHGGCGLPALGRGDGDFSQKRRDAREPRDFRKEAADFHVRIFARLQAAEKFQNELLAVDDRGIGLFRGADARGQVLVVDSRERGGSAGIEAAVNGIGVSSGESLTRPPKAAAESWNEGE